MKKLLPFLLISLAGCATPKYVANWDVLESGMSKSEVVNLLGQPSSQNEPIRFNPQPEQTIKESFAGAIIAATLFDGWLERWHYGKFEFMDNLLKPSDQAYVLYFNGEGKLVSFRKPQQQAANKNVQATSLRSEPDV